MSDEEYRLVGNADHSSKAEWAKGNIFHQYQPLYRDSDVSRPSLSSASIIAEFIYTEAGVLPLPHTRNRIRIDFFLIKQHIKKLVPPYIYGPGFHVSGIEQSVRFQ